MRRVIVVGGGIAGCTITYELARRGCEVTLLERDEIAAAASGLNAGVLTNPGDPLQQRSLQAYRELPAAVPALRLREIDVVVCAFDDEGAARLSPRGASEDALTGHQVADLYPPAAAARAGVRVRGAHLLDARAATLAYAAASRDAGAVIQTGVAAHAVATAAGRAQGVVTSDGLVAADAVVLASGPWLAALQPAPIVPVRGWLMRLRGAPLPPVVLMEAGWGGGGLWPTLADVASGPSALHTFLLVPLPDGDCLLGASLIPSIGVEAVDAGALPLTAQRALSLLPALAEAQVIEAWSALRPMTPDHRPLAGGTGVAGLYLHGGHGTQGMQWAPATAIDLAAQIVSEVS